MTDPRNYKWNTRYAAAKTAPADKEAAWYRLIQSEFQPTYPERDCFNAGFDAGLEAAKAAPADEAVSMPLCAGHGRVDRMGHLVLEVGNSCVACSLNERTELLGLLAPFIPSGGADSVTTLNVLIAAALTNLLAEVIETRDMLAAADGVRLPGPLNCGIGLISLSDGWAIKNSPGCLGDTRYPTALEAYRAMKENV
jgi:hypothetical protein